MAANKRRRGLCFMECSYGHEALGHRMRFTRHAHVSGLSLPSRALYAVQATSPLVHSRSASLSS